jgi:uncharacterized protein YjiS (DUF1127 family)
MTDHTWRMRAAHAGGGVAPGSIAARLVDRLLEWMERARARHALAELTDAELKDIGLSRTDVANEAAKPFWRA